MKKFLWTLFVFVFVCFFFIFLVFNDTQTNHYSSLHSIKAEKAIQRGWIPSIIPDSAYNIQETHNLDSNRFYGSFYYKENLSSFMKHLKSVDSDERIYEWDDILFYIDIKQHKVWYRNKQAQ